MFQVKVDNSQVLDFTRKSPVRARWATAEALKMTGGHYRKELRAFIEKGGRGWRPLHPVFKAHQPPQEQLLRRLWKLAPVIGEDDSLEVILIVLVKVQEDDFAGVVGLDHSAFHGHGLPVVLISVLPGDDTVLPAPRPKEGHRGGGRSVGRIGSVGGVRGSGSRASRRSTAGYSPRGDQSDCDDG